MNEQQSLIMLLAWVLALSFVFINIIFLGRYISMSGRRRCLAIKSEYKLLFNLRRIGAIYSMKYEDSRGSYWRPFQDCFRYGIPHFICQFIFRRTEDEKRDKRMRKFSKLVKVEWDN